MNGIKISAEKTLGETFASLYARLDTRCWIILPESIDVPWQWEESSNYNARRAMHVSGPMLAFETDVAEFSERHQESEIFYGYHATADFFLKYAETASSDWSTFYGMNSNQSNPEQWLKMYYECRHPYELVCKKVRHLLAAVDGAFYLYYTADDDLLNNFCSEIDAAGQCSYERVQLTPDSPIF